MKVTVIGVAGGTGSGKSTLVKRLQEAFEGDDVVTLCHDYYYKAHPELTYEERTKLNYDHPQAFDTQMLVDHIKALKENVPIEHPVYSFVEHNRMTETVSVKPSKVIIVDGILIFENKELRDLMDIKVYVDTDADIRLARRILRDVCERGRTMQSVITQYTSTGEADARGVRRTFEEIRRRHHSRRRLQLGGRSDADSEHQFADRTQRIARSTPPLFHYKSRISGEIRDLYLTLRRHGRKKRDFARKGKSHTERRSTISGTVRPISRNRSNRNKRRQPICRLSS